MHKIVRMIYAISAGMILGVCAVIAGFFAGMYVIEKLLKAYGH